MGTFIPFFIRIIKTIIHAFTVLVFFILVYVISIQTLSYLSTENFKNNESPPLFFRVVLEIFEESLNQKRFDCVRWDDFKEMHSKDDGIYVDDFYSWRRYKAYLSETNGWCQSMSSEFEVENIGPGRQRVRLRWAQEASKVENHYSVVDNKIVPLYFREFMSADIVVDAFFISLILTPIFIFTFRFCVKKYKEKRDALRIDY